MVNDYVEGHTFSTDFAACVACDIRDNVIKALPAADVAPVVHGEWLKNDDNVWWEGSETRFCSCCGQAINVECIPWFKFCPNCGAKMDGGKHNE